MAQLLVKIELQGTPEREDYMLLDQFMSARFWERIKRPGQTSEVEHAMYCASTFGDRPNLNTMANELKRTIEYKVWDKVRIFIVQPQSWTEVA